MLDEWGLISADEVKWWVDSLSVTGIFETTAEAFANRPPNAGDPPPARQVKAICEYDCYNLCMSGLFIQECLSVELWNTVEKELPDNPTGPEILFKVIQAH